MVNSSSRVSTRSYTHPSLSADGRWLAYDATDNQVYVWDSIADSNTLVSVNAAGTGLATGISKSPVIAADGRNVAFLSTATNLVANITIPRNSGFQIYARDLTLPTNRLVCMSSSGQPSARDLEYTLPSLSQDGQLMAFESTDDALVADDLNQASDVFLRDLAGETIELLSARNAALPTRTAAGISRVQSFGLSPDGRFAVFSSYDSNLVPGDTDGMPNLFIRDLISSTSMPINIETNGWFATNRSGVHPIISSNGQYVLFLKPTWERGYIYPSTMQLLRWNRMNGTSEEIEPGLKIQNTAMLEFEKRGAPDMSPDGNSVAYLAKVTYGDTVPLFLRDITARTNRLVNRNISMPPTIIQPAFGHSKQPRFSPDGRWLVFQSQGIPLTTNIVRRGGGDYDLFAFEVTATSNIMVSVDAIGDGMRGHSEASAFSASGRHLAFYGTYTDGNAAARSYLFDFATRSNTLICTNCSRPWPSEDARWVAYQTQTAPAEPSQIMLKDMQTGEETLVSADYPGTGGGNGSSTAPQISPDGRFVVFASTAGDLVANDMNHASDIFVYDRSLGRLLLASANLQGTGSGNRCSVKPVLSADGRTVLFESYASDLIEGDYNETADVLVLRLGAGDSDNDGLPDDWEVAHFGDLSRDGAGDQDGDGLPDRQEYLAGTDPTNQGSVLQVLTLASVSGGPTTLLWSAVPGKTYAVQYKDRLEAPWSALPGAITATGGTASALDAGAPESAQRFYRVILVP